MPRLKLQMDINKMLENIKERGYSLSEMNAIERKIKQKRLDWIRHFDQYIEILLNDGEGVKPINIIKRAESLADAREELLDHKFEDGIIE
jgi:hypothetical protein